MVNPLAIQKKPAFYAPRFRVTVGGKELHEEAGDVLSIQFKDSIKDLSGAEFVLNNWQDDKKNRPTFKYSDGGPIDLGREFVLEMGYADEPSMRRMMVGEIIAFEPQFPASGSPTLVVRGLDLLHRMRNKPQRDSWPNKTDSEIATEIARRNGLESEVTKTSPKHATVPQDNKDDLSFLVERAKRLDFEVFICEKKLHFVRTREGQSAKLELEYGKSLISFSPSLTLAKQVSKVTVRAWHPIQGVLIEESVERSALSDLKSEGKDAAQLANQAIGDKKEEVIITEAVTSKEDAKNLAESVLRRNSHSFITGSGQTIGIPELRAGVNITLKGLGTRFDGPYYVTESTHRIDASGYQTTFSVRKAFVKA